MSQSSSTLVGHDAHLWTESGDDVYRSSGSVGIGTAVPSTSLHVLSNSGTSMTDTGYDGVTIESSAANEPSVISFRPANDDGNLALVAKIGATSTGATTNYNGSLGFSTRTGGVMSQQMTIDSAGLVGIGTDSPTEQLHVLESSDGDWVARFEQDHATGYGLIVEHAGSVDNRYGLAVYDGSNFDFVVTTAGNVGIGTETPLAVLGVKGASGASADSGTAGIFHITTGDAATDEQLQIGITDEVGPWLQGIKKDTAYRNIALQTQGGKVGIGVAVPATKLTVEGSVTLKEQAAADSDTEAYGQIWVKTGTPNTLYFTDDAGTDVQLGAGSSSAWTTSGSDIYYNTGGVGIGTASPADYYSGADNLVVYEAGDAGITIATGTTNTGALYFADGTTGDAEYRGGIGYIHATATERLALVSGGAEKVTILDSGEVGIGTTVPSVLLHCSGGANEAGLRLERSSGLSTDGTTYIGSLEFEDDAETPVKLRAVRSGSSGAAAMTFETGNASDVAERVRISADGKVGIGTETGTVSSLLHIKQSSGGDSIMLDIECNNDGGIRFGRSNHGSLIYHRTTAKDYMGFVCDGSAQPTAPSNAQLPMMVINEDGNIGMGTGSDALTHKLEIRDIGKFTFDGSGNPELSITNNTATSLTNGTASLVFGQAANSRGGKIVSGRDGDYGSTADRSSFMAFYTSRSAYDTEAMRISSDGKIIFRSGRTCLHAANDSSLPSGITEYAVVLENTQGANDREFNIADITRSTSGWGYSHYTVEIFAHYPTGGSYSKYFVYYVYSSVGVKTIQEPIGVNVSGYGVRLAGEQTVSGNIKRASIMIDLPAYGKATVKLTHVGATHVSSWNSSNENFASRIKYNI